MSASAAPSDTAPLVSIRDLSVAYGSPAKATEPAAHSPALSGIDLDIHAGERLAVIGESGSGKSTLALAIAGLLPETAKVSGSIQWLEFQEKSRSIQPPFVLPDISPSRGEIAPAARTGPIANIGKGEPAAKLPISPLEGEMSGRTEGGEQRRWKEIQAGHQPRHGRDIGFVFQDPSASLDPVMSIGKQIAEVAHTHLGLTWRASYERALALLERVRLPDPRSAMHAFPHQLSGGQKQRVAIAAAIAAGPRLLIADEATSALDTIVQAQIVTLIRQLVAEDGMTLLFVSHDIALAAELADRIAVFRHGKLVEIGTATEIIDTPHHAYTRALLDAHIGLDAAPMLRKAGGRNG